MMFSIFSFRGYGYKKIPAIKPGFMNFQDADLSTGW